MSEQYFTRPNVKPVITYIGTTPEQRQMSTDEFKAKFDEMPEAIQQYIKETLLTELDAFKQEFMTHQAEKVTQSSGIHGLEIDSGTWSPTIQGSTLGNNTFDLQRGIWYRINNLIYISGEVRVSNFDPVAGAIRVGGLPFVNTSGQAQFVSIGNIGLVKLPANTVQITAEIENGTSYAFLRFLRDNDTNRGAPFSEVAQSGTEIKISATYIGEV